MCGEQSADGLDFHYCYTDVCLTRVRSAVYPLTRKATNQWFEAIVSLIVSKGLRDSLCEWDRQEAQNLHLNYLFETSLSNDPNLMQNREQNKDLIQSKVGIVFIRVLKSKH